MNRFLSRHGFSGSRLLVALILLAIAGVTPALADNTVEARKTLKQMGVEYNEQQFAKSAGGGDMTAVRLFLEAGMDINSGGGAAIGLAAGRGQTEMVKWLLEKGAKPTANALQFARTRGHKEIEQILIKAGAKE